MTAPLQPQGSGPLRYVPAAQDAAKTGVQGFGEAASPYLTRQIGTALGGLNSIGALRSGAVPTAMGDIATDYGREVGGYAKQAAGESLGAGLAANEQDLLKQQLDQQRKSALLGAIGSALGTGLGFAVGGPAGARAGGTVGKFAGDKASGSAY